MTRCYEFYCAYEHNPKFCSDKGDRIVDYIEEYIAFMRTKGIAFDKTPTDKARFVQMQEHYGSEGVVAQGKLGKTDLELPLEEETHNYAEPIPSFQTQKTETPQILPSFQEKSVEPCPDGKCSVTPEQFQAKVGITYRFDDCGCRNCKHHNSCFGIGGE